MMAHIIYDNVEHWCNIHQRNQHFFSKKAQKYVQEGKLEFAIRNQNEAASCYRLAWLRLAYLLNVEEPDERAESEAMASDALR